MYYVDSMTLLIIFLICVFVTLIVGALAGLSDIRCMKIPNSFSLYVVAAFFIAYAALYFGGHSGVFAPLWLHVISGVLMFVATAILFSLKMIGAGDSKFATACAFWIGAKYLPVFLFFMTLGGGLLGVVALYIKRKKPFKSPKEGSWVAQVQGGADKVPYGVAITFGMLIAFMHAGYFSSEALSSFVDVRLVESGS